MDREQLVEKMTESAAQGLHEAIFGVGVWQRILPGERAQWCGYVRAAMRAALGVAESVVREDERLACLNVAHRWTRDGHSATAHGIILGIEERTGGTP